MLDLIVAIDSKNGISKDGEMAWHVEDDMKFFKRVTDGNIVIMGFNTFHDIAKRKQKNILPNRKVIVLTSKPDENQLKYSHLENVLFTSNADGLIQLYKDDLNTKAFVAGGVKIYEYFYPHCFSAWVTKIDHNFKCDKFFPFNLDKDKNWKLKTNAEKTDPKSNIKISVNLYFNESLEGSLSNDR